VKTGGVFVADQQHLGLVFGVGAGAIWAVEAVLGKMLFHSATFLQVAATEAFFAAVTAFAYALARRTPLTFPRRNVSRLVLVGLVGTVLAPVLYFFGLSQTFAINATLIAHLQPLLVAVFSFYLLDERLQRRDLLAGLLIVGAAVLITGRTVNNLVAFTLGNVGDVTVLGATVSWAIVAIPGKQLTEDTSSSLIVCYRFVIASLVFLPLLLSFNQFAITSPYQILLGVLVGLGYVFYYEGLRRSKASHIALTELSAPFFTAILAWYFLGEILTPLQTLGALLLFCGLFVLSQQRPGTPSIK
jgi:drug/metabolite transporter (DMT)-like permease